MILKSHKKNFKYTSIFIYIFFLFWVLLASFPFLWTFWGSFKVELDFFSIANWTNAITGENTKSWKKCLLDSHLPSYKRLSMTASPIEYTTESLGFSGMENIQLFGNKFHQYLTLDAIFDNYISPIEIYGIEASPNIVHDIKQKINANRNIIQRNLINTEKVMIFQKLKMK